MAGRWTGTHLFFSKDSEPIFQIDDLPENLLFLIIKDEEPERENSDPSPGLGQGGGNADHIAGLFRIHTIHGNLVWQVDHLTNLKTSFVNIR